MTYLIFIFLSTGLLSGFLAGLLGVGGGIIIVPIVYFVLLNLNYSLEDVYNLGFLPTMGSLHKGHISLIKQSKKKCNKT